MADHTGPVLDLSHAAPDIISMVFCSMPLRDRCTCALAWAEVAAAVTRSIILQHRMQDLSGLQIWLEKYGNRLEVLQLHACGEAALNALPCCAELQDLLLHGCGREISIASRTWGDIASATKLTSVSLSRVQTASQQADVVSALTALPNLEQLTWCEVQCSDQRLLSDSLLLQQMTQLTSLGLHGLIAAALQHLGSLTKLQHLSISAEDDWSAAGYPGLQELMALTSLNLSGGWDLVDLPASASQLTALRQLNVPAATPTALNGLHVLTNLTQLCVWQVTDLSRESPPLKLPGLQQLELYNKDAYATMPMSFLASCTQLQFLKLQDYQLEGPGSLVASTMLQHLEVRSCSIAAADAADLVSWRHVLLGPGQLPHLTSLQLFDSEPTLQQADVETVVSCCSNLKMLGRNRLPSSFARALARLPGLTKLQLRHADDKECIAMVQLTGLRQLIVMVPWKVSVAGLRQLAALQQLTSLGFGGFCQSRDTVLDSLARHLMKDNPPDREDEVSEYSYALINKAPSGSPPDVSPRLLGMCNVVDACTGLRIEAVVRVAKREPTPSRPQGCPAGRGSKTVTAKALLAAAAALKA